MGTSTSTCSNDDSVMQGAKVIADMIVIYQG